MLHFITHLALGGAERIALDLVRGLRDGFDSAIFAVRGVGADAIGSAMRRELEETRTPLFTGTRVPLKWGGLLFAGQSAARTVAAFQPDLIHLHTEIPEASYAAMVSLRPSLRHSPIVRTIHNSVYWHHWPRLGRWCDRRMAQAHIAGVSQGAVEAFERLRRASAAGAPPAPPVVIFNGVALPPSTRPPRTAPSESIRVLFAGRFEIQKGTDLLARILTQLRLPSGRGGELMLHGVGAHESALRALAAQPPPGWSVRVAAPLAGLAATMPEFDFVLMPSRFEGQSLVAIEAMLQAVPLVATDAPGLREQLPADYPWRARAGDADDFARVLQRAFDDPAQCRAIAGQAQAFARDRFDPRAMFASYRRLYAQALEAGRAPRA